MQEAMYRLSHSVESNDYETQKELLELIVREASGKLKRVNQCIEQQRLEDTKEV